jgi:hypothetical protein
VKPLLTPTANGPLALDVALDLKVTKEGGFLSELSFVDRQRLRKVVKNVHMKHYPAEMITDREADRMIEAIAPETQRYLIERMWDKVK